MTWLKKINDNWIPSEKRDLKMGEIMDFPAPYVELVKGGMAVLVDEAGNELELPGQTLNCPICFADSAGIQAFLAHVTEHSEKSRKNLESQIKETEVKIEENKKDILAIADAEVKMKGKEVSPVQDKPKEAKKK